MLLSLQFPIADLRSFLEKPTGRLPLPGWPLPLPQRQFVRGFGPIVRRRRSISWDHLGENRVCEAHHALRFIPVARPEFQCAYRRFFFDGKVVGKFDIGLTRRRPAGEQPAVGIGPVLLRALGLHVLVPSINKEARQRALHAVSGHLARAYLLASTEQDAEATIGSWTLGGIPMLVVEYGPGDLLLPPTGAKAVPSMLGPGAALHHYWLRPTAGVELSCWLLYSSGTEAQDSMRHLRICLSQLHAQRSCLELILHSIAAGTLSPPRGSGAHKELDKYLNSTRRQLSRMRKRGTSFGPGFLEAAEAAFEHINPFTSQLLKKLDEALHHLGLRYTTKKGVLNEVGRGQSTRRKERPIPALESTEGPVPRVPPAPGQRTHLFPKVDVLIVTALKDERDAVLSYRDGVIEEWQSVEGPRGFNYHRATFKPHGRQARELRVAVARPIRMGELYTANLATRLMALSPEVIAMSGICAGDRRETKLGDVIVADRVFKFDHGKLKAAITAGGQRQQDIFHDLTTYSPRAQLIEAAQEKEGLWRRDFPCARPIPYEAQERWLLRTLASEGMEGTLHHPERLTRCPAWEKILKRLKKAKLLKAEGLALTGPGARKAADFPIERPDGEPEEPRYPSVFVAPIATTSYVQEDPELFQSLRKLERKTLGVEMEGAAIGAVAALEEVRMLVVKAVSDYADHDKDDQFRIYAAQASAWFLLDLLRRHWAAAVPGEPMAAPSP